MHRLVSVSSWLILLTLASLIWQLVSNSLPLFATPKVSLQEQVLLPAGKIMHIGDLAQNGFVMVQQTSDDEKDCPLRFLRLDALGHLVEFGMRANACQTKLMVHSFQGQTYLFSISREGVATLENLWVADNTIETSQLLSFAINKQYQYKDIKLSMSRDQLIVATKGQSDVWHSYWTEMDGAQDYQEHNLGRADFVLPIAAAGRIVLASGNNLKVLGKGSQLLQDISLEADVTQMHLLSSKRSFVLSFSEHNWQQFSLFNKGGELGFHPTYRPDINAATSLLVTNQTRGAILFADQHNRLHFYNSGTGEVLRQQPLTRAVDYVQWHNGGLYTAADRLVSIWSVEGMSQLTSLKSLFAKNWYEGYRAPAYVWQSTVADGQQPKYSLVPLIIGSFKAAILALFIAIPIATSAAIYTAYFAHERLRNWLKPAIEMLEAVPSVIIGFIAAVWLTPISDSFLLPLMVFILLIPVGFYLMSFVQRRLVGGLPKRMRWHWELLFASLALLLLMAIVFGQAGWLNTQLTSWLDWQGDKSTLVVALALGVAIAPTIYSVAEDAIHGVPQQIKNASFALGATRLQTLQNVVLTVSLPGILSGITLGFGRAFGETMILLMVTGNTPIAEWNLVSGIRALTANLAIELPEAQPASDLYHVLFFSALLLFAFTFCINGLAEWLRIRLRRNYQDV